MSYLCDNECGMHGSDDQAESNVMSISHKNPVTSQVKRKPTNYSISKISKQQKPINKVLKQLAGVNERADVTYFFSRRVALSAMIVASSLAKIIVHQRKIIFTLFEREGTRYVVFIRTAAD